MMRKLVSCSVLGAMMLALPGNAPNASAAETQYIKIATLAPDGSDLAKGFRKLDKGLRTATNNGWGIKLLAGGVAGDEIDVIRKMKVGQLDASIITATGLSQIVRDVNVLDSPGVINNYKQLEAVQAAMTKEWEESFTKSGFNLMAWGETGQYRWFAKNAINKPSDIKTMRPWLWPASHVMKEIFTVLGASSVPLGLPEVTGALKTGMVDMIIGTSVAVVALQWHASLQHVTEKTTGVLIGAMIMSKDKYAALPPEVQAQVQAEIKKNTEGDKDAIRKDDERSFQALVKRGYVVDKWDASATKEYETMADAVRKHLVGRVYSQAMLDRVMKIAASAK